MQHLSSKTKGFALKILKFYAILPSTVEAQILGKQLLRCGLSVGAHYREAMRSRSKAEFVAKIEDGLQRTEEVCYWLELLAESGIIEAEKLLKLEQEAKELISIFMTMSKRTEAGRT